MTADLESIAQRLERIDAKLDRHLETQGTFESEMRSRLAHLEEKEQRTDHDCREGIHRLQMDIHNMQGKLGTLQSCNDRQEILMGWLKQMLTAALITGIGALIWAIVGHIAPSLIPGKG